MRIEQQIERVVKAASQEPGNDYSAVAKWYKELRESVQALAIQRLEPAINQAATNTPHATLAEKQSLCRWINKELRDTSLGLVIRCPKTGLPSAVHAGPGGNAAIGHFQIEVYGDHRRTKSSIALPQLTLMAEQRRESLADYWASKVSSPTASRE